MENTLAIFPDIVAVRQVLMDGLTAVKKLTPDAPWCLTCLVCARVRS